MAHRYFDATWSGPNARMTRVQAYQALQEAMGLSEEEAHIGRFDQEQCRRLIELLLGHSAYDCATESIVTIDENPAIKAAH